MKARSRCRSRHRQRSRKTSPPRPRHRLSLGRIIFFDKFRRFGCRNQPGRICRNGARFGRSRRETCQAKDRPGREWLIDILARHSCRARDRNSPLSNGGSDAAPVLRREQFPFRKQFLARRTVCQDPVFIRAPLFASTRDYVADEISDFKVNRNCVRRRRMNHPHVTDAERGDRPALEIVDIAIRIKPYRAAPRYCNRPHSSYCTRRVSRSFRSVAR